jgi:hypothetical protein
MLHPASSPSSYPETGKGQALRGGSGFLCIWITVCGCDFRFGSKADMAARQFNPRYMMSKQP